MALIAHWPLNGNTNDISGFGKHGSVQGATTNTEGKIGGSYTFANTRIHTVDFNSYLSTNAYTYTAWINRSSSQNDYNMFMGQGLPYFSFRVDGTLLWSNDVNGTQRTCATSETFSNNTWYHFTATYDGTYMKIFVNGVEKASTSQPGTMSPGWGIPFSIGDGANYTWYPFYGKVNDVRIYDHALTDMEIQEIARAKILHYTFDDMQEPTTNLSGGIQPTFGAWGTPIVTGTSVYETLKNGKQAIHLTSVYGGSGGVRWRDTNNSNRISVTPSTNYTMSAFIKYSGGDPSANLFYMRQYRADNSQIQENGWYSSSYRKTLKDGWYYAWRTVTLHAECTNVILESYEYSTNEIWMYDFQFEKKDYPTEYVESSRTGRVNDYSGFFNHSEPLTETTTPRWTTDAKIGTGAYEFSNKKITGPGPFHISSDRLTLCAWVKPTGTHSDDRGIVIQQNNNYYLTVTPTQQVSVYWYDTSNQGYHTTAETLTLNQWSHIASVWNGTHNLIYINGLLVKTTATSTPGRTIGNSPLTIGRETDNRQFIGYIDDVRQYATALSDKDIKDLYETRAEIEQSGVLYARDFLSNVEETVNYFTYPMTQEYFGGSLRTKGSYYSELDYRITATSQPLGGPLPGGLIPIYSGQTFTVSGYSDLTTVQIYYRGFDSTGTAVFSQLNTTVTPDTKRYFSKTITLGLYPTLSYINLGVGSASVANYYVEKIMYEIKDHATPFVSTYRPAIQLPSTIEFGANEVHETGTANFEDFSTVGITDGLVGYWPLDKNVLDYSGENRNATALGPVLQGDSYYFDGINDTLNFGTGDTFFPIYAHTISIMFKSDGITATTGTSPALFGFTYGIRGFIGPDGHPEYTLYKTGFSASVTASDGYNYHDGQWHLYTATCDGITMKLYLDGVYQGSANVSAFWDGYTSWPTNSWNLGRDNNNSMYFFRGNIKQHKLFNRALTAEEIAIEYNTMFKNEVQIHESGVLYAKDIIQY